MCNGLLTPPKGANFAVRSGYVPLNLTWGEKMAPLCSISNAEVERKQILLKYVVHDGTTTSIDGSEPRSIFC